MPRNIKETTPSRVGGANAGSLHNGVSSIIDTSGSSSSNTLESSMHPNLGLHSASASGNIGLVKYALENGQPHSSILNGLLALHAACSGGNEAVVRLLLSYGADINAPRQRTAKGNTASIGMGSEGSTPLHFAAANGHTTIVRILLESGARPAVKDKDGNTPEMLAMDQNYVAIVSILRNFVATHGPNGLAAVIKLAERNTSTDRITSLTSSPLRAQRSMESLSSAAAGVKATLRHHKKQALAKVSSNPNLKSFNTSSTSNSTPLPPPLPTSWSRSHVVDSTNDTGSAQSTPPNPLSSANNTTQQSRDSSKRRPSLPSIFERAAPPASTYRNNLLTNPNTALPHPIEAAEDEATSGKLQGKGDLLEAPPSTSPSRPAIRLPSKKSLTGLFGKAGGSSSESTSPIEQRSKMPSTESNKSSNNSFASINTRNRSKSSDLLAQPSLHHISRSEGGSSSSQTSPSTSIDNSEGSSKPAGLPLHPSRPRKSSNLTTASSPLINEEGDKEVERVSVTRSSEGLAASRHGRKRSQSATSVPKRPATSASDSDFARQIGRVYGSHFNSLNSPAVDDDSKEILQVDQLSSMGRSKTPTRMGHQRFNNASPRTNRSPLLSSKVVIDSSYPSSPSLNQRPLQSQRSSSSLVSSTSSHHLLSHKSSRSRIDLGTESVEAGEEVNPTNRSYRSASQSEVSMVSKGSSTSLQSLTGLSAQEQAQAILRTADERNTEGSINLTQMLAAYGEALAQERGTPKTTIASIRKQISAVSLNSLGTYPSNRENLASIADTGGNNRQGWDSPLSISQSAFDRGMPSISRSSSSLHIRPDGDAKIPQINLGDDPFLKESNDSQLSATTKVDEKATYKQSPSLPADISRFAAPTTDAKDRVDTMPKSKGDKSQHRSTVSDPYSLLLDKKPKMDTATFKEPSLSHQVQKMASSNELNTNYRRQASTISSPEYESRQYLSSRGDGSANTDDRNPSPTRSGKRKGAVKAFLSGIKSNVVK